LVICRIQKKKDTPLVLLESDSDDERRWEKEVARIRRNLLLFLAEPLEENIHK
jgi:hypothetical protein